MKGVLGTNRGGRVRLCSLRFTPGRHGVALGAAERESEAELEADERARGVLGREDP